MGTSVSPWSTVLAATAVLVLGGDLVAGSQERHFANVAVIRLVGDRLSRYVRVEADSGRKADRVSAGPKVLLVLGRG